MKGILSSKKYEASQSNPYVLRWVSTYKPFQTLDFVIEIYS